MLAIKNRVGSGVLCLFVVMLLGACRPAGPQALWQGRAALEGGEVATALVHLQRATTLLPTNAAAWNYLGVAYHRAGEWTNAAMAYSQALRLDRDLLEARLNLGLLWLAGEQWDAARLELTAYTLSRPNDPEGWYQLGLAQAAKSEGAAEKSFRESLRLAAEQPNVWNALGLYYTRKQRGRDAAGAFEQALQIKSNHPPARLNLAIVTEQLLNDRTAALRHYRTYLQLQPRPEHWEGVNALVQAADATVKPMITNRVAVVSPASPRGPSPASAPTKMNVASVGVKLGEPVHLVSNLPPSASAGMLGTRAVSSRSTNGATIALGVKPAPATEAKPAAEPVRFAGVINSSNSVVVRPGVATNSESRRLAQQALMRGQQEQQAKKYAEALQHYRRAVQLDPGYFEAHYLQGLAAFQLRNFKAAITAWETALGLRPNSADARYNYALALKADSRLPAAADELEKLLALHPDEARGHLTLGNIYADQIRDIPRARRHYLRVLQLDPRNPQAAAIRFWLAANPAD